MPISLASVVGNFLFAPFLTVFLLLSSFLFFAHLVHLPCGLVAQALELATKFWLWLLQWGSPHWLCELPQPPLLVLLALGAATLAILMKKSFTQHHRIIAFACLLVGACALLRWFTQDPTTFLVQTSGLHSVTIMHSATKTALIDRGGMQYAGRSWARYKLKPELIKRLGRSTIDYCIVTNPRPKTLNGIASLCNTVRVKTVYLPAWQGSGSVTFWSSLGSLRCACRKRETKLLPLRTEKISVPWDSKKSLVIVPAQPLVTLEQLLLPRVRVQLEARCLEAAPQR